MEELGKRLLKEGIVTEKELEDALERQQSEGGRLGQNLVALGYIKGEDLENFFRRHPVSPKNIEETGLSLTVHRRPYHEAHPLYGGVQAC